MAHHVHKTQGLILNNTPSGESNVFLVVFTRELGLVKATAQGARLSKSKLRYGIQKYDISQLSFVYGKSSWRLTNAVPTYSTFYENRDKRMVIEIISNTCSLLSRLLTGEEKNTELFDLVAEGFTFIQNKDLTENELKHFEFLFILRILYNLGYISGSTGLEILALGSIWNKKAIQEVSKHKKEALEAINRAILESQL